MDVERDNFLKRALAGAGAGFVAAAAMSLVFFAGDRLQAADPKPPRLIVDHFLPSLDDGTANGVAVASHLLYGMAAGKAYAVALPARLRTPATGVAFGLAVWAAGYEGWVCATGVLPPAHRDHRGRAATILLAHVVFGAVLGYLSRPRRA